MRAKLFIAAIALSGSASCGVESIFVNAGHDQYERPASKVVGATPLEGFDVSKLEVIDGDGNVVEPFLEKQTQGGYEFRLPSSKYGVLRVRGESGNMELRSIVPGVNEESQITGVDLDARNMAETLIAEARLSADGSNFKKVTPEAYLGTRALIRAAFDVPGPTQDFLNMVQRLVTRYDPMASAFTTDQFAEPKLDETFAVKTSPVSPSSLARNPFDYVGDGTARSTTAAFDAKLVEVAKLYRPAGCPDPSRIRVLFTADFNAGAKDSNGNVVNRFKWATDKPGKGMFFVGWTYTTVGIKSSDIIDPAIDQLMGNATPNTMPMYDDGTNGDEKAGDNIWSITFDLPRSTGPDRVFRMGYKYTWGTQGAPWTGSEEWPGNARILEVVDDNDPADDFVYRRDVFGDEASNKDKSNAGPRGTIDWNTPEPHGCGIVTHENRYDYKTGTCLPKLPTPDWIGPLTVTCS